ncbi:RNA recognition motif containing protein [Apiospora phragmitis]|uniref:RNA recognition motif containing protein n=1 Tax=Apiospora phragmitis TaxID=2905665 RepID=A0ABR1W1R4_9PEZI
MTAATSGTVTIDRNYFETLLRRANVDTNDFAVATTGTPSRAQDFTIVPNVEYETLLSIAHKFSRLRQNLINGGVTEPTIAVLSQDVEAPLPDAGTRPLEKLEQENTDDGGVVLNHSKSSYYTSNNKSDGRHHTSHIGNGFGNGGHHGGYGGRSVGNQQAWGDVDVAGDDFSASYSGEGLSPEATHHQTFGQFTQNAEVQRPQYARMCKRTIVLAGLPDNTKHEDITRAVRGGQVLEVFIRSHEHMAMVSFLREEDAVRFYDHSRRHDLYINNKRVFIKWAERHFHLAGHVAHKIVQGATRNMVIRRVDPTHTEDSVRDDLEHIHNLVVIKIEFLGGSCYIKTNSVHNAMFARTCMMSRAKYKGSKIDWDLDECAQPLRVEQKPPAPPKPQRNPSPKKPAVSINRFATLRLDDEDDESDDKFDTSSEFPASTTVGVTA